MALSTKIRSTYSSSSSLLNPTMVCSGLIIFSPLNPKHADCGSDQVSWCLILGSKQIWDRSWTHRRSSRRLAGRKKGEEAVVQRGKCPAVFCNTDLQWAVALSAHGTWKVPSQSSCQHVRKRGKGDMERRRGIIKEPRSPVRWLCLIEGLSENLLFNYYQVKSLWLLKTWRLNTRHN